MGWEHCRIADVNMADNIGVDDLSKHLPVAVTNLPFQFFYVCQYLPEDPQGYRVFWQSLEKGGWRHDDPTHDD